MVLVSDLLADPARYDSGPEAAARSAATIVLVFHVMDDDELDFPFSGPTRFEGLESIDYLNCNPRALREGYLEAVSTFLDETATRMCSQQRRLRIDSHQPATGRRAGDIPQPPLGY